MNTYTIYKKCSTREDEVVGVVEVDDKNIVQRATGIVDDQFSVGKKITPYQIYLLKRGFNNGYYYVKRD
jgi:hypothetical protein